MIHATNIIYRRVPRLFAGFLRPFSYFPFHLVFGLQKSCPCSGVISPAAQLREISRRIHILTRQQASPWNTKLSLPFHFFTAKTHPINVFFKHTYREIQKNFLEMLSKFSDIEISIWDRRSRVTDNVAENTRISGSAKKCPWEKENQQNSKNFGHNELEVAGRWEGDVKKRSEIV